MLRCPAEAGYGGSGAPGDAGMRTQSWTAAIALAALAMPIAAGHAQTSAGPGPGGSGNVKDLRNATMTHLATGFHFPPEVAGFERVSVQAFNGAATDVSISYASLTPGAQLAVTVFVTPAPAVQASSAAEAQSCDQQFAAMDRRITKLHPDARQLVVGNVRSPSPQYAGTGKQVIYDYDDVFYGQKQTLRSETDLYCYVGGNWLVAFRATAPVKVDYAPKLASFMRALAWPSPGMGRPVSQAPAPPPSPVPAPVPPRSAMASAPIVTAPTVAAPIPGNRVLVRLKAAKQQAALAGLVVTGGDADLQRFETAASQRGVSARRMTEGGKTESIASLLKPEIRLADATDLYRHARDGKFGKLKLEVMLLPPTATGDERELLSQAAIVPATAIEAF
jgi:hypothetical protein